MTRSGHKDGDRSENPGKDAALKFVLPAILFLSLPLSTASAQLAAVQSTSTDTSPFSQSADPSTRVSGQSASISSLQDSRISGTAASGDLLTGDDSQTSIGAPVYSKGLSADAIISFLEQNPDVTVELKDLVADRVQDQGGNLDRNSISDQQLYDQIEVNPSLRSNITTYLRARGYELEDDENPTAALDGTAVRNSTELRGMEGPGNDRTLVSPQLGSSATSYNNRPYAAPGPRALRQPGIKQRSAPASTDLPKELHLPTPYNLNSLRDLYTQVPVTTTPLQRFGSDFFPPTTQRPGRMLPANSGISLNMPASPDYVLGPGDSLSIDLWGGATLSFTRIVERDGRILLPEAGSVQVAGMPLEHAEAVIAQNLRKQYRNASVAVTLARLHLVHVNLAGDIRMPGSYEISALATSLDALQLAGGPNASGSLRTALHMRGDKLVEEVDLYSFFLHGKNGNGAHFESNDTLLIPPAGSQVAISGAVRRPAIYELKPGEQTLASVFDDAGGLLPSASLNHVTVDRTIPGRDYEIIPLNLSKQDTLANLLERAKNFPVQDGDRIRIDPVLPYSERVVYLDGHVARPGRMPYRDGMRLSDALRGYRDLLPEPAERAEIVRLVAPDLHAEAITFDLPAVLRGLSDMPLKPFDTIRTHSRYEADAPHVTISGEVLHPGIYPLSEGMTAAQLVRISGGFKRDAYTQQAELTSYQIQNGAVTASLRVFAVGNAFRSSDSQDDITLKPGDIVSIRQLSGWEDIGQSIQIEGQVCYPGTYGFRPGERLSSVLRRAGGLLPTAYPMGAVLVREQVRDLEQKSREELIRQIQANSAAARLSPNLGQQDTGATLQFIQTQQEQVLADLKSHPPAGRMVIHITPTIESWADTPEDIELRRGDVLTIPKQPGFVLTTGQVYNSTALTFTPNKTADWYLRRAGGTNTTADRKEIFVIRANGSVIGRRSGHWFGGDVLSTRMNPGDVIVVPQKIIGKSLFWRNLLTTAQLASSIAITAAVASI